MYQLTLNERIDICHISTDELISDELENATDDYISVLKHTTNLGLYLSTEAQRATPKKKYSAAQKVRICLYLSRLR